MTYNTKRIRRANRITQQQLADRLGVTVQTVKNWEGGRRGVAPRYHAELAKLGATSTTKPRVNSRPKYADLAPGDWDAAAKYSWAELKYDGHYVEIKGGPDGWTARNRIRRTGDGGLEPLPVCHLLCEHITGTEWARESDLFGGFVVWGALSSKGVHLPRATMSDIVLELIAAGLNVTVSERFPIENARAAWEYFVALNPMFDYAGQRYGAYEGLIFRTAGGRFARMKARQTMDYVCTGFYDGSIIGALYNGRGKLIDKVSVPYDGDAELDEGRVFEASGLRITARGSLRNPRFGRWRDDKDAKECTR